MAHYLLAKDGTIFVVAAGHCNHAGVSLKPTYLNGHRIGIEAEATGVPGAKGDWPAAQMDSYARLCRALAAEFRFPVAEVLGHKETCAPHGRRTPPARTAPVGLGRVPNAWSALESEPPRPFVRGAGRFVVL